MSAPSDPDYRAMLRALLTAHRELLSVIEKSLAQPVEPGFIPTEFQKDVLTALKNRSLRTDGLAHKLDCGRSRLFADPGGLPELQEQGLVSHHKRIGYYRPDAPPPDMDQNQD